MKPLLKIIDFNVDKDDNALTVELNTHNTCHIKLDQFEQWLERTDRLEWVRDWADHDGDHFQVTGKYSFKEYWAIYRGSIHQDIYDFIVINFIDPVKGIKDSITKITNEYAR